MRRSIKFNVWITFNGETKIITDWLRELEMCYNIHKRRLDKGMTHQESFEETLKQRREIEARPHIPQAHSHKKDQEFLPSD